MMTPRSEAELADAVRSATGALRIIGGGTRPIGNPVTGEALSLARLSGIELYEPGALTLVARAGTPLAEIEAALSKANQRLAFEPMDHRALLGSAGEPTIGGVVAGNVSGPRRIQAGACRDSLIGVRFVDGTGAVIKNGGRVMKNVTGYDLVKLLAGSYGTLGVLSEVSFKLLPGIDATATLIFDGLDMEATRTLFAAVMGSPYEVSGAARLMDGRVLVRVEGFSDSVAYRLQKLVALTGKLTDAPAEQVTEPEQVAKLWKAVRDVADFSGLPGSVWRISVKPSDMVAVSAALPGAQLQLDWAGGLIWALVPEETDVRAALAQIKGHATLIRASEPALTKFGAFEPESAPIQTLNKGIRAKFDPRGILNPGLMGV